jgi:small-conductance mechanosensitive channel
MIDNDIFEWLIQIVSKELKREEFRDEILKPLVRSMISYIMPYVFFIIAMNVFLIILAFTCVLYFLPKR